jgi:hypothetical protein
MVMDLLWKRDDWLGNQGLGTRYGKGAVNHLALVATPGLVWICTWRPRCSPDPVIWRLSVDRSVSQDRLPCRRYRRRHQGCGLGVGRQPRHAAADRGALV